MYVLGMIYLFLILKYCLEEFKYSMYIIPKIWR